MWRRRLLTYSVFLMGIAVGVGAITVLEQAKAACGIG